MRRGRCSHNPDTVDANRYKITVTINRVTKGNTMKHTNKKAIFLCLVGIVFAACVTTSRSSGQEPLLPSPTATPFPEILYPGLDTHPPAPEDETSRTITCDIHSSDSNSFYWNGSKISYSGYDDVDFSKSNWEQEVSNKFQDGLQSVVPPGVNVNIVAIDIRRVQGKPKFLYLSNGTQDVPFQTWSSSKFIATMNAIRKIRELSREKYGPTQSFGANAYVKYNETWGKWIHLGDLITFQHSYQMDSDENGGVSNGISSWFLSMGTRARATDLLHTWLHRSQEESFTQGYGAGSNGPAEPVIYAEDGKRYVNVPLAEEETHHKKMSTLTLAETLKRLVTHHDLANKKYQAVRFPEITDVDVETLLYGSPQTNFGGMQKGIGVYLHNALGGKENLDAKTHGKWRIFSKIGYGFDRGGEFVFTGSACLPDFDGGHQFVISAFVNQYPQNEDPSKDQDDKDDALMSHIVKGVTELLVPGFVDK